MLALQKQIHVVGKRRERSKASAETCDEKNIHGRRNQMRLLGQTEEDSDNETADDVDRKGAPREWGGAIEVTEFANQKAQAGAYEATDSCNDHSLEHNAVKFFNGAI